MKEEERESGSEKEALISRPIIDLPRKCLVSHESRTHTMDVGTSWFPASSEFHVTMLLTKPGRITVVVVLPRPFRCPASRRGKTFLESQKSDPRSMQTF